MATCTVGRGLYVLRYNLDEARQNSPAARIQPSAGYEDVISVISAPGEEPGHLGQAGSALVVLSLGPAMIDIILDASDPSKPPTARFTLELIAAGPPPKNSANMIGTSPLQPASGGDGVEFFVAAHVSRRGDVSVDPGEWIAGPQLPATIEGLSLKTSSNELTISAQYINTISPEQWSSWQSADFVGSRQKASPLLGVKLRLGGALMASHELEGDAMFLASPVISARGPELMFKSPSGMDPLVGFRIKLNRLKIATNASQPPPKQSRVRIFRSGQSNA